MRRVRAMRMVFVVLLLLLCGRLYYVQILCADELTAAAQNQQLIPVIRENVKGVIYDRNMEALTGTETAYYYLIHKDNLTEGASRLLIRMEAEPAGQKGEDYLVYRTEQYSPDTSEMLQKRHKAYGFAAGVRYGENQTAAALVQDLDEMYAHLLQKDEPSFYFLGNAAGGFIHGTGMTESKAADSRTTTALVTTLDGELQEKIETLFEESGAAGCAVVTDTRTGQVLAMVSDTAEANLPVECAYPIGNIYDLFKKAGNILNVKPADTAAMLGLGEPVFDGYPGENAGVLDGKKTTATAVQFGQALTIIANHGQAVPLTLVMNTLREESVPCMELTGEMAAKLAELQAELAQRPLTGDGWSAGYSGVYGIAVHLEKGKAESIYHFIETQL